MALAPAWIVSRMVASVGPPVAMMGISGNFSRICRTMAGVSAAPDTFRMSAPQAMRLATSILAETMVAITGISTTALI